jgi:hypothetical protein
MILCSVTSKVTDRLLPVCAAVALRERERERERHNEEESTRRREE